MVQTFLSKLWNDFGLKAFKPAEIISSNSSNEIDEIRSYKETHQLDT